MKYSKFVQIVEASIDDFMSKIKDCKTIEGLEELEEYYKSRSKETDVKDSDDIAIRDAIEGRKEELEQPKEKEDDSEEKETDEEKSEDEDKSEEKEDDSDE